MGEKSILSLDVPQLTIRQTQPRGAPRFRDPPSKGQNKILFYLCVLLSVRGPFLALDVTPSMKCLIKKCFSYCTCALFPEITYVWRWNIQKCAKCTKKMDTNSTLTDWYVLIAQDKTDSSHWNCSSVGGGGSQGSFVTPYMKQLGIVIKILFVVLYYTVEVWIQSSIIQKDCNMHVLKRKLTVSHLVVEAAGAYPCSQWARSGKRPRTGPVHCRAIHT